MEGKDNNIKERRKEPRYDVSFLVDIYLKDQTISANAINISERGIGITLPCQLSLGEIFDLKVRCSLEDPEKPDMDIKAEVIWCIKIGGGLFRAGLEIVDIHE